MYSLRERIRAEEESMSADVPIVRKG